MNIDDFIISALKEDIGDGDHTSLSTIPETKYGKMQLLVKQEGIIAGIDIAKKITQIHDKEITIVVLINDGTQVAKNDICFILEGKVISMLSVERLILNFMQRMSGIATYTRSLSNLISDLSTKILDTRKTTPNFRIFEKMAVNIGGGLNHRFGLYDMILIKDNHVDFAGGIENALKAVKAYLLQKNLNLKIEIEVRNLIELEQAINCGIMHRVMFDNFSIVQIEQALKLVDNKFETEASGNINHTNIRDYALTGIDFVSIGALTHHISSLDLSLKAIS